MYAYVYVTDNGIWENRFTGNPGRSLKPIIGREQNTASLSVIFNQFGFRNIWV